MNQTKATLVPAPSVVTPEAVEVLNVLGGILEFSTTAQTSGGGCTQFVNIADPGLGVPMHVHAHEDELFLVLQGTVRFEIEGEGEVIATPGTSVFGPRNVPHAWFAIGDKPVRILVTVLPGGLERMFRELAALPPPPALDMAKVLEICGRYGIRFL